MIMIRHRSESTNYGRVKAVTSLPFFFSRLPLGIAGIAAACLGVVGAVVGMSGVRHQRCKNLRLCIDQCQLDCRCGIQAHSEKWQERSGSRCVLSLSFLI
jgi:hypothetical protein